MTEKEKMLRGAFYDTRDSELRGLSNRAKDLMRIYNNLPAENMDLRNPLIRSLFGFCGENIRVNQPIWVDYGCNISLGAGSVVTEPIPANAVACGNPCAVKKLLDKTDKR